VETVAVRVVHADRRRTAVAVARRVAPREFTLPRVGHMPIAREEFVTPRVVRPIEAATRGKLPLGFRRQLLPFPPRVGPPLEAAPPRKLPLGFRRQLLPFPPRERFRVTIRDVHDGMVLLSV